MRWIRATVAIVWLALVTPAALRATEATARVPRVGILLLEPRSSGDRADMLARAMRELGYPGDKIVFDVRSADWSGTRLHELARQLVATQPIEAQQQPTA